MDLLVPIGLLGLIGLLILLIIYILKPNYQQKFVSSTYIWKLSLKYRKKKIPINKLRNLLILLCQVLICIAAALILSKPAVVAETSVGQNEKIIIVDASASMLASCESSDDTRFDRALKKTREIADETLKDNGTVTVILAGEKASYVVRRAGAGELSEIDAYINGMQCSLCEGDVDGAMLLAEETLRYNADSEILLLTGTTYVNDAENVTIVDVSDRYEWNVAVLSASARLEDNFYTFEIEVACYGLDKAFEVFCEVGNVNGKGEKITLPVQTVNGLDGIPTKIVYTSAARNLGQDVIPVLLTENERIYSFDEAYIHIDEADSLLLDNEFFIYGGLRPTVKIQYYSTASNVFFGGVLRTLKEKTFGSWNIEITEVKGKDTPATEGFDFYIFEHTVPKVLPKDGIIFLVNPDSSADAGFSIVRRNVQVNDYDGDGASLAIGDGEHPLVRYMDVEGIKVTQYSQVDEASLERYDVLMYYEGNPVFFARNEADSKIAVMTFSLNMSTLALSVYYPILIYNMFNYYLPSTLTEDLCDVYDTIEVNARGSDLIVTAPDGTELLFGEFPAKLYIESFGTYTLRQQLISGEIVEEKFYAKVAASQSDITREDVLSVPFAANAAQKIIEDLLVWFAAAIVALMFLEWALHSIEGL